MGHFLIHWPFDTEDGSEKVGRVVHFQEQVSLRVLVSSSKGGLDFFQAVCLLSARNLNKKITKCYVQRWEQTHLHPF